MSTKEKIQKSGPSSASAKKGKRTESSPSTNSRDVGQALRSIYQKTVDEAVPSEMLDLLGKLG
nr:NepR family anti-sigma factor [Sphingomonas sp. LaA6.9]